MKNKTKDHVDVIIIYGPTAVGKSAVGVELAKKINGEIISADSMQIYKHLNVGTAKVSNDEMEGIKHYLIDFKEPTENYSAQEFCFFAKKAIYEIVKHNKVPIIVGGTGLYIKSLTEDYNFSNVSKNEKIRNNLQEKTTEELAKMLKELNPNKAFDEKNRQRMIRYIEIELLKNCEISKNEKSDCKFNKKNEFTFNNSEMEIDYHLFCLLDDREKIYERINKRVTKMVELGVLEEAKYLQKLGFENCPLAGKAIGYKEFLPFLNKESSLCECTKVLQQKTRNYAKRQITFLNQFKNKTIINLTTIEGSAEEIKRNLQKNGII